MDGPSPDDNPLFLQPEPPADYTGVTDLPPTFDDELEPEENSTAPSLGYIDRYNEIARRHAMGQTNKEICIALGYTSTRMSIVLRRPYVQERIGYWRKLLFDEPTLDIIKRTSRNAVAQLERRVDSGTVTTDQLIRVAQFSVEQTHGKARQGVDVKHDFTDFREHLNRLAAEMQQTPRDVTALPEARNAEGPVSEERELDEVEKFWATQP